MHDKKTALLDASSAILLAKVGLHETLTSLYNLVLVQSVFQEITANKYAGSAEFQRLLSEDKIEVVQEHTTIFTQEKWPAVNRLDAGERDSLLLFLSGRGDFLITDDGSAVRWCREQNIPFINALLVPKILVTAGFADAVFCQQAFLKIEKLGRYSKKVISLAKSMSGNDLEYFIPST